MKLPKSWEQVTLKQYIEIIDLIQVDMDELDKQVRILSVLSGLTVDEVESKSITQIKEGTRLTAFLYSLPKYPLRTSIRIKGNRYHINTNIRALTGGEYIEYTSYIKEKDQVTQNIPDILSIFFKPVNFLGLRKKKCYLKTEEGEYVQTLQSKQKTAKLLREHLTMDVVMGLTGFFLKNCESSIKATQAYLIKQMKKNQNMVAKEIAKMDLENIGDGS